MIDDAAVNYVPLCDIKGCIDPQCGEIFEGQIKLRFMHLRLGIRIHPCSLHLRQLKNIAVPLDIT